MTDDIFRCENPIYLPPNNYRDSEAFVDFDIEDTEIIEPRDTKTNIKYFLKSFAIGATLGAIGDPLLRMHGKRNLGDLVREEANQSTDKEDKPIYQAYFIGRTVAQLTSAAIIAYLIYRNS